MAGRPEKLTLEVQQKLCQAIAAGNYYKAACRYAGIVYRTFRTWMKRGQAATRGRFFDFFQAIQKARSESEVHVVALWRAEIPGNWQAARDFLARRFSARWGPKQTDLSYASIKGSIDHNHQHAHLHDVAALDELDLPLETVRQILDAIRAKNHQQQRRLTSVDDIHEAAQDQLPYSRQTEDGSQLDG